jgi:plastocyanin
MHCPPLHRAAYRVAGLGFWSALAFGAMGLFVVAPASAQEQFGTIKGRLVYGGAEVPKPKEIQVTKDPEVCGVKPLVARDLMVDPKTKGVAFGVAYLVKPSGANPEAEKALLAKSPEVVVDQKQCEFVPYGTAVHQSQKIVFASSDPINHNVRYNAFVNPGFNQIVPPNGKVEAKLVAEKSGSGGYRPLLLFCDIHPWMKGYIMVFDHPYFAITKEDGSFEIQGVPAGKQNLVVWQSAVGFVSQGLGRGMPVTVKAGETTDIGEVKLDPAKVKP